MTSWSAGLGKKHEHNVCASDHHSSSAERVAHEVGAVVISAEQGAQIEEALVWEDDTAKEHAEAYGEQADEKAEATPRDARAQYWVLNGTCTKSRRRIVTHVQIYVTHDMRSKANQQKATGQEKRLR